MMSKWKKIFRISLVLLIIVLALFLTFLVLKSLNLWEKLNSVEKFRQFILNLGFWGRSIFVIFQFLQVTFIPIPSPILIIAGSLIYGTFQATILSLAGILLGSAVAFFLGRVFGKKIVNFMVGEEASTKWCKFLCNYKISFIIMMLLPFFPDDILCLVAGLTDMSWTYFMTTQFLTRPIGIFCVSYFSNGEVIPYHGYGLIIWAIIIIVSLCLIYFSGKYSKQIENFFIKKFAKKKD